MRKICFTTKHAYNTNNYIYFSSYINKRISTKKTNISSSIVWKCKKRTNLVHSITLIFCFSMRDDDEQTYLLLLCEYHIRYHSTCSIHSKTPLSNIKKMRLLKHRANKKRTLSCWSKTNIVSLSFYTPHTKSKLFAIILNKLFMKSKDHEQ